MNFRGRWNRTTTANRINVVLTSFICLATVVNVVNSIIQSGNQNGQAKAVKGAIEQVKTALSDGTIATKNAIESAIKSGNDTTKTVLQENRTSLAIALEQNKSALAATVKQGQSALSVSVTASQLDQRPWVGLADFGTIGGAETEDHKGFSYKSVQIAIRNSGKTPAVNLSAVTLQTGRDWREKIGDYDAVTAESKRQREEASAKLLDEQIRRNPAMADQIRAWDKEFRDRISSAESELFPAGQVLAPGVVISQGTVGINYTNLRDGNGGMPVTLYILGKVTYNDIFTGTPLHTTKFCLMRLGGTQFTSCPTGNYMD